MNQTMSESDTDPRDTCWTLIEAAGQGDQQAREEFAALYLPAIRSYLQARWKSGQLADQIDDAQQEVFVECLKEGGVLARVERSAPSGFRGFLYGAVRNVAGRVEERRRLQAERSEREPFDLQARPADDRSLSQAFDRAFAIGVLRSALRRYKNVAESRGGEAALRFELLRKRFHEGKSIAVIAKELDRDASVLHHEYATARQEFQTELRRIVTTHHPGATAGEIDRECEHLVELVDE